MSNHVIWNFPLVRVFFS